jgi:hypothetical protein
MSVKEFLSAPTIESCRLVPFDKFQILESNPPLLMVSGEAPCLNMEVSLRPVIYIDCPDYWRIEVVGCLPGAICLTAVKPYTVCLSLEGIIGSEGIEIAGSNRSERERVSGGCTGILKRDLSLPG